MNNMNIKLKGQVGTITPSGDKALMTSQITTRDLIACHTINRNVNREIEKSRLPHIHRYLKSYTDTSPIFLPAFVAAFSGDFFNAFDSQTQTLTITPKHALTIIDGQHRITALQRYVNEPNLTHEEMKERENQYHTIQIYLSFSEQDMKNLFTDINSSKRRISTSLQAAFDTRNVENVILNALCQTPSLRAMKIEQKKHTIVRPSSDAFMTQARLTRFINYALFNKPYTTIENENYLKEHYTHVLTKLTILFDDLYAILPDTRGNVRYTVLAHEAIQNAIAKYLYPVLSTHTLDNGMLEDYLTVIERIDWRVDAPQWQPHLSVARRGTKMEYQTIDIRKQEDMYRIICEAAQQFNETTE